MLGFAFTLMFGPVPATPAIVDAVQEINIDTSVDEAGMFRLRLAIARTPLGDWTLLDEPNFRPFAPVTVRLTNNLGIPEALINGYVSRQQVIYALEPGDSVLEITGMDATVLMSQEEKIQRWPNMPDSAIATTILGRYRVVPRVQPTPPLLVEPQGATTQRATDINFLRQRADRNGFDFYVQPEPLTGLDMAFFQPPQLSGVPSAVLNVNMGPETNVADFQINYEMTTPTSAVASSIDVYTNSTRQAFAPVSTEVPMGLEPALLRGTSIPVVRPANTGLLNAGELQNFAQSIADRSSFAVTAEGTADPAVGILRPGSLVNVRGAGRLFNGSYYVTRVSHTITREDYTQRFHARRNAVTMTGTELYAGI